MNFKPLYDALHECANSVNFIFRGRRHGSPSELRKDGETTAVSEGYETRGKWNGGKLEVGPANQILGSTTGCSRY
jgi:hypothetical protein